MGARGPKPKDPEKRQRERTGDPKKTDLALLPTRYALPEAPEWATEAEAAEWDAFWSSELGRLADPETAGEPLRRLLFYRREWRQWQRVIADPDFEPFSKGSTGQTIVSPAYKQLAELEKQMQGIEDRYGLNPRQRIALGASVVDTQKGLEDLVRRQREQSNPEPRPAPLDLATDEG